MSLAFHCRVLAVFACLLVAVSAWGTERAPGAPPIAGLGEARSLAMAGKYDEALALLRPLVASKTVSANALFLFGLASLEASQAADLPEDRKDSLLDDAIAAFRAMLIARPDLLRVRLELARAFFLKEEDGLARRHFERVLAGKPSAAVALNVGRFLAEIRSRKRWSLRLGMSLAPDSNVGSGSDERIVWIGGLPFRRSQEDLTTSGIGIAAWAGGEYQLPLGETEIGSQASRWRLRVGGNISRREYKNRKFDRMSVSGHAGPRVLIDRATEASLLASARRQWAGSDPSHYDAGLRVETRKRLTRQTTATLRAEWHDRRYDERTHLDGPVMDVSLGGNHVLSPTLRGNLAVGWGRERPESLRWRNERRWLRAGIEVALPAGFTVGGAGTLRWTDYEGNWGPFVRDGSSRRDLIRNIRVYTYNRAITVAGFSPQLSLVQEQRDTNAQLYDYERIFGELSFVRLF